MPSVHANPNISTPVGSHHANPTENRKAASLKNKNFVIAFFEKLRSLTIDVYKFLTKSKSAYSSPNKDIDTESIKLTFDAASKHSQKSSDVISEKDTPSVTTHNTEEIRKIKTKNSSLQNSVLLKGLENAKHPITDQIKSNLNRYLKSITEINGCRVLGWNKLKRRVNPSEVQKHDDLQTKETFKTSEMYLDKLEKSNDPHDLLHVLNTLFQFQMNTGCSKKDLSMDLIKTKNKHIHQLEISIQGETKSYNVDFRKIDIKNIPKGDNEAKAYFKDLQLRSDNLREMIFLNQQKPIFKNPKQSNQLLKLLLDKSDSICQNLHVMYPEIPVAKNYSVMGMDQIFPEHPMLYDPKSAKVEVKVLREPGGVVNLIPKIVYFLLKKGSLTGLDQFNFQDKLAKEPDDVRAVLSSDYARELSQKMQFSYSGNAGLPLGDIGKKLHKMNEKQTFTKRSYEQDMTFFEEFSATSTQEESAAGSNLVSAMAHEKYGSAKEVFDSRVADLYGFKTVNHSQDQYQSQTLQGANYHLRTDGLHHGQTFEMDNEYLEPRIFTGMVDKDPEKPEKGKVPKYDRFALDKPLTPCALVSIGTNRNPTTGYTDYGTQAKTLDLAATGDKNLFTQKLNMTTDAKIYRAIAEGRDYVFLDGTSTGIYSGYSTQKGSTANPTEEAIKQGIRQQILDRAEETLNKVHKLSGNRKARLGDQIKHVFFADIDTRYTGSSQ